MRANFSLFLIALAVLSAFTMNAVLSLSRARTFDMYVEGGLDGTGEGRVATALQFLYNKKFSDGAHPFFGAIPRGPVYPIYLAIAFSIFGESLTAIWIIQMITFTTAVLLFYAVSARFLSGWWAALPPAMLTLFWAASLNVFRVNNEVLTLFLVGSMTVLLMRYYERKYSVWHLAGAAFFFSLIVLLKPAFEYFIFFALGILVWHLRAKSIGWYVVGKHLAVFLGVVALIVGGWHMRNMRVWGTPSISVGGHALLLHAQSAHLAPAALKGFVLASLFGDYIAEFFVPGYAEHPEPATAMRNISKMLLLQGGAWSFSEDAKTREEALSLLKEKPFVYAALTPMWFFRLNSIPSLEGGEIDHMFVGTHPEFASWMKASIILVMRFGWLFFILLVFYQIVRAMRIAVARSDALLWIIAFILYTNVIYASLTHALVRYILPVMPFYFLFFVMLCERWYTSYLKKELA